MTDKRCTFKRGQWNCGSYQFNLYKDDIDQGDLCDVHYWQTRAQPAQEPVAWAGYNLEGMCEAFDRVIEAHHSKTNPFHDPTHKDAYFALRILRGFIPAMKSYTTPPKREWVGLTDEEISVVLTGDASLAYNLDDLSPSWIELVQKVEAKLKEKNT